VLGNPIMMSERQSEIRTASPERGEHTQEILRGLGLTDDEIEKLRADRVAL
jgi:crotonobetainyl-CoA:carnitine CoA-transferase CaiB-like acyl-CoA transferase